MTDTAPNGDPSVDIKELREAAERGTEAVTRASQLEKENAFLKAGVDVDSPLGKLLFNGYNGEITTDAIKAAATEVGALKTDAPAPPPPPPAVPAAEQQQTDERNLLAGGSEIPGGIGEGNPHQIGIDKFYERLRNGDTREDSSSEYFDRLFDAAGNNDQRVLYDREAFQSGAQR